MKKKLIGLKHMLKNKTRKNWYWDKSYLKPTVQGAYCWLLRAMGEEKSIRQRRLSGVK